LHQLRLAVGALSVKLSVPYHTDVSTTIISIGM